MQYNILQKEESGASSPCLKAGVSAPPGTDDEAERLTAAYGPNWERLRELKSRWDPDIFFRMNQNIEPQKAV